jgi:hypothetical protein
VNINKIIQEAKLGAARKDAQVDACAPFAAALYDVLSEHGIACQMAVAIKDDPCAWTHSMVNVADRYYDSMGEFSTDIYRNRAKIHPKVELNISYLADSRHDCYEPEFDDMYAFYVKVLNKAFASSIALPKL